MSPQVCSKAPRILVADDNRLTVELVSDSLEPHGFVISAVDTGDGVLEEAPSFHPDLILLDLKLPGLDGFAAASQLRSGPETKQIPIIAMTAYSLERENEITLRAVFDGFLLKPFGPGDLLHVVNQHLANPNGLQGSTAGPAPTRSGTT